MWNVKEEFYHRNNAMCSCEKKIFLSMSYFFFSSTVLRPMRLTFRKQWFRLMVMFARRECAGHRSNRWCSLAGIYLAVDRWLDGPSLLEERKGPRQLLHPLPNGTGGSAWDRVVSLKFSFSLAHWRSRWRCRRLINSTNCSQATEKENAR